METHRDHSIRFRKETSTLVPPVSGAEEDDTLRRKNSSAAKILHDLGILGGKGEPRERKRTGGRQAGRLLRGSARKISRPWADVHQQRASPARRGNRKSERKNRVARDDRVRTPFGQKRRRAAVPHTADRAAPQSRASQQCSALRQKRSYGLSCAPRTRPGEKREPNHPPVIERRTKAGDVLKQTAAAEKQRLAPPKDLKDGPRRPAGNGTDSVSALRLLGRGGEHRYFASPDSASFKGREQPLGEQFVAKVPEPVVSAKRNAELPLRFHSVTIAPYLYQRGMITKRRRTIAIIPSSTPVHNPLNCLNRIK